MASAEQRANKKEELIFLTSGAKEKLDKTMASMKGAARVMIHPLDKEAREQAKAKTVEEKSNVGAKQAALRDAAHQQGAVERAAADGITFTSPDVPAQGSEQPHPAVGNSEVSAQGSEQPHPAVGNSEVPAQGSEQPHPAAGNSEVQRSNSGSGSDASARARAQIPPSSAQYQSA